MGHDAVDGPHHSEMRHSRDIRREHACYATTLSTLAVMKTLNRMNLTEKWQTHTQANDDLSQIYADTNPFPKAFTLGHVLL